MYTYTVHTFYHVLFTPRLKGALSPTCTCTYTYTCTCRITQSNSTKAIVKGHKCTNHIACVPLALIKAHVPLGSTLGDKMTLQPK